MVTKVNPGVTFTYQTLSGFWLTRTELDCIGLELEGNWKREQGLWVGPALCFYIAKETREYIHENQWKMI